MEGCGAVLLAANADISTYNLRYRVCEMHLRAEAVLVKGKLQRFCQVLPHIHLSPGARSQGADMRSCAEMFALS